MIPKRIFYVWGYGEKKSLIANICIENWRMMLPDYEIIEINEKTPEWFDFDYEYNNCLWFKTVYDLKMWAYVSDYMRLAVLYKHGGIYFDTDVTVYKNFDNLLDNKMFIGNTPVNIPDPAIMGACKTHPIIGKMLDFYTERVWKEDKYVITHIFIEIFKDTYNKTFNKNEIIKDQDITIYPYYYFTPCYYTEEFSHDMIKPETYTCHWQRHSWASKKNLYFLSNKHRIPIKVLLKQLDFIENVDKKANKKIQP